MTPEQRLNFFGQEGDEVTKSISGSWARHPDRREILSGQAAIVGMETRNGLRLFRLDEAFYYDDAYTKSRWPNSRGPELASMEPGEVIAYKFHQTVLTFIKVGERGSSANIQLSKLTEVDRTGAPLLGSEAQINAGKVAQLLELEPQTRAQITPFNFRNIEGFLITTGSRTLTPEDIARIEEELLS